MFVLEVVMKCFCFPAAVISMTWDGRKFFIKSFLFFGESLSLGGGNLFLLNVQEGNEADSPGLQFLFAGIFLHFSGNSHRKNLFCSTNHNDWRCSFRVWISIILMPTFCSSVWYCWTLGSISEYCPWRLPYRPRYFSISKAMFGDSFLMTPWSLFSGFLLRSCWLWSFGLLFLKYR